MDSRWIAGLARLAKANARAHRERLRQLTREDAIREFEALCEEVHGEFPDVPARRDHPVGLVKLWKRG